MVVYNPNLSAFGVLQFTVDYDNSGLYMPPLTSHLLLSDPPAFLFASPLSIVCLVSYFLCKRLSTACVTSATHVCVHYASGFIVAKSNLEVVNAAMYGNAYDGLRAALEIMIALMWFVYVFGMVTNMIVAAKFEKKTWAYFNDPMHIVFAIQLVMFALVGALWIAIVNDPSRSDLIIARDSIKDKSGGPPSFTSTVLLSQAYYIINGINMLLAVVQLLSFFQINYNLSMLTDTIGFMIGELFQFCIVLITMISSFMLLSHLYFGQYMKEFSTLDECFINVFEYLFSRADFFILAEVSGACHCISTMYLPKADNLSSCFLTADGLCGRLPLLCSFHLCHGVCRCQHRYCNHSRRIHPHAVKERSTVCVKHQGYCRVDRDQPGDASSAPEKFFLLQI